MESYTNSSPNTDEEELAVALRLSQLSSDAFDEHVSQLCPGPSELAKFAPFPTTRPRDNDLAIAPDIIPQRSSPNASEENVDRKATRQITLPDECDEDDLQVVLRLSELPADLFDEQLGKRNQQGEPPVADGDSTVPLLTGMSFLQVWILLSPYVPNLTNENFSS